MEIRDFMNQAPLNYPPLTIRFNEHLKDVYTRNTKLSFVEAGGDLELEGEIVRYDLTPLSVKEMGSDGGSGSSQLRAAETRLTMSVRIRYRNNVQEGKDKEETITAYRDFSTDKMLDEVQDDLIKELTEEIADQIFNATLSDW